jgi:arsenate reductase
MYENPIYVCVANSARSQIAEGLAKQIFGNKAWIESAGSEPKFVSPFAEAVLKEIGIDISKNHSKSYEKLPPQFIVDIDYIITLCAEEVCPVMASNTAKRLHWPFPDPATKDLFSDDQILKRFREARDAISKKIKEFSHNN